MKFRKFKKQPRGAIPIPLELGTPVNFVPDKNNIIAINMLDAKKTGIKCYNCQRLVKTNKKTQGGKDEQRRDPKKRRGADPKKFEEPKDNGRQVNVVRVTGTINDSQDTNVVLDSGAAVNVLSSHFVNKNDVVQPSALHFTAFNGHASKSLGIEPTNAKFASPILFVKKPDGSWRLCVEFRDLNKVKNKDHYQLPLINSILSNLDGAEVYSKIDLVKGYHQILIKLEDRYKTSFTTPFGTFQWLVMPFGLTNAPAIFQRLIDSIFKVMIQNNQLAAFIDDFLIKSKKGDEKSHEELVLETSNIWDSESRMVAYFQLLRKISNLLMTARFIPNLSRVSLPLTRLLTEKRRFKWTKEEDDAKDMISVEKFLFPPVFGVLFEIDTDASNEAIGAVLYQYVNREKRIISYLSRKLIPAECNYSTGEKELLLAMIYVLKSNYHTLLGYDINIHTDHQNLKFLLHNAAHPMNFRLNRWIQFLDMFRPNIIYIKGEDNLMADGLSKYINIVDKEEDNIFKAIADGYELEEIWYSKLADRKKDFYSLATDKRIFEKECLRYLDGKIVVPHVQRIIKRILKCYHDNHGHLGVKKTEALIKEGFIWNRMNRDIETYVTNCHICMQCSDHKRRDVGELRPLEVPEQLFGSWSMDFIPKLPEMERNGCIFNGLWVLVDRLSKLVKLIPIDMTNFESDGTVSERLATIFISEIFKTYGMPKEIVSDQDPLFISKIWRSVMNKLGTNQKMSLPYHYSANGQAEITVRLVKNLIRKKENLDIVERVKAGDTIDVEDYIDSNDEESGFYQEVPQEWCSVFKYNTHERWSVEDQDNGDDVMRKELEENLRDKLISLNNNNSNTVNYRPYVGEEDGSSDNNSQNTTEDMEDNEAVSLEDSEDEVSDNLVSTQEDKISTEDLDNDLVVDNKVVENGNIEFDPDKTCVLGENDFPKFKITSKELLQKENRSIIQIPMGFNIMLLGFI
eukprot:gene1554-1970_t